MNREIIRMAVDFVNSLADEASMNKFFMRERAKRLVAFVLKFIINFFQTIMKF